MRLSRVPVLRGAPSRLRRIDPEMALFESWHGSYSDSPRAISEELHRRGAPLRQVWVLADGDPAAGAAPPSSATVVRPDSARYLEALGRARYLVTNNSMPGYFRKKPGTTYVQTWHGTPLKRIAFDIPAPTFRGSDKYLTALERDVQSWNFLVSQNTWSTPILRRAFRYDGTVLEAGYPRNDVLRSPEAGRLRERVRAAFGVAPEQTLVLYAPTWRDNDAYTAELPLGAVADALGESHVFLLRAHHLVARTVAAQGHPRVRDASRHPEISDLYLAADVLVSDYSSVMFDFAVTGRPMLFFTYDLAEYRDRLRGFYVDFEAEAPGPLLATAGEVIDALRDLDAVAREHGDAYRAFVERYCHLDDGHATARVVDAAFDLR